MSFKEWFIKQVGEDEFSLTKKDLEQWLNDFNEVKEQVNEWISNCKSMAIEEQLQYLIGKLHHILAFGICSDTSEPLEYIDFNYGSITCVISVYDRTVAELLPCIDGYVNRNGEELSGCYTDIDMKEVEELLNEWKVGSNGNTRN